MKNKLKRAGIILEVIAILLTFIIGISLINHKIQLSKENSIFVPNGKLIEVNGHKMHLYIKGQGHETLVFMSGGGTSSPVLDFKSLYSLLEDKYKIAVVEKAGYGFSEIYDDNRDIDTILEETREALSKAGLEPPYILFPHSMSGIEALYWAQQYPKEVKGIVGLDMAVPEAYENFKINNFMLYIASFASNTGITRFFPSLVNDSASIKYGTLTQEEKDLYRAIFYRRTLTKSMLNEVKQIKGNAKKVKENAVPNVPMLFFISNSNGTGWDKDKWTSFQTSYIETLDSGKYIELDCEHYIHNIEYKKIAEESTKFIKELINTNEHNAN
ncbi:MAG: alpha/beta fold hydrolase [Clostridiales bacterium]|nr:alpha/beta fold hydrolase [Clostridiales bacterium]